MSRLFKSTLRKEFDQKVLRGNKEEMRKLFLQPKGLQMHTTSLVPRPRPVEKFVNHTFVLHRSGKDLKENTVVFKCDPKLTKPEIKQYFTKIYGLDVERVCTVNAMGKIKKNGPVRYRRKDFKKVYLELRNQRINEFFQKNVF